MGWGGALGPVEKETLVNALAGVLEPRRGAKVAKVGRQGALLQSRCSESPGCATRLTCSYNAYKM